ncbi:MAG: (d)CMP kinase, partial [Cutibacterium granulosum]
GSMYRALACAVSRAGINPQDEPDRVIDLAGSADIRVDTRPGRDTVVINGVDVTEEIRDPRTSARVSAVATIPQVRVLLVERMRDIVERNDRRIVVEGRDITTVVCPDAQVRVLLVADPAVRMARRARELGDDVDQTQMHDQIVRRDRDDATVSQFETPAPGVTLIDSTSLDLDEVVARVVALTEQVG